MKRLLIPVILLLFALPYATAAQDDEPPSGWPIVERCVTPTVRPDGWTFEGAILLEGYAGIHGVTDAWPTPRVLVFLNDNDTFLNDNRVPGGALSPDGNWYAEPEGDVTMDPNTYNVITGVDGLQVFSTVNADTAYRYTFDSTIWSYQRTYYPLHWQNDNRVVYGRFVWNFLTGETFQMANNSIYAGIYWAYQDDRYPLIYPSPDWTLVVFPSGELREIANGLLVSSLPLIENSAISWNPDSSLFMAEINASPAHQLVLFDRTGNIVQTVLNVPSGQRVGPWHIAWSSDRRYFAFIIYEDRFFFDYRYSNTPPPNKLYIADTQNEVIFDTCINIGQGAAFSPDNTQLAILEPGTGTKYVMVLDLESWALHPVANHIVEDWHGSVIGWRED